MPGSSFSSLALLESMKGIALYMYVCVYEFLFFVVVMDMAVVFVLCIFSLQG